jgi:hypothetical protein
MASVRGRWKTLRPMSRARPIARARDLLAKRGAVVVFLSRWLISALGPYVGPAACASGMG